MRNRMPPKNVNVWLGRRAAHRRQLGPLLQQKISASTLLRYRKACTWFLAWLSIQCMDMQTEAHFDFIFQDYIEELWNCNAGLDSAQCIISCLFALLTTQCAPNRLMVSSQLLESHRISGACASSAYDRASKRYMNKLKGGR